MSTTLNYDVHQYFKDNSPKGIQSMQLTAERKRDVMRKMKEKANSLGMKFIVSDIHNRDLSEAKNCCGLPSSMRYIPPAPDAINHAAEPLGWSEYLRHWPEDPQLLLNMTAGETGLLSSKEKKISVARSLFAMLHEYWNNPEGTNSIMNLYGNQPKGRDENGDGQYMRAGGETDV
jgi:hypothetical protein